MESPPDRTGSGAWFGRPETSGDTPGGHGVPGQEVCHEPAASGVKPHFRGTAAYPVDAGHNIRITQGLVRRYESIALGQDMPVAVVTPDTDDAMRHEYIRQPLDHDIACPDFGRSDPPDQDPIAREQRAPHAQSGGLERNFPAVRDDLLDEIEADSVLDGGLHAARYTRKGA